MTCELQQGLALDFRSLEILLAFITVICAFWMPLKAVGFVLNLERSGRRRSHKLESM